MNKKSIVFVNQSSGYLMIDIIEEYSKQFDQCVLMAGLVNARTKKLPKEVNLHKVKTYNRDSSFKRIYTWLVAWLQVLYLIKTRYRDAHLFLVSNPPFTIFLPFFVRNSFSLLIYDVYPDILVQQNMFSSKSWLVSFWIKANKRVFKKVTNIYTISEGMKGAIAKYVSEKQIKVVPVWTDNEFLKPIPRLKNPFARKHELMDKFVISYSGNFGKTHEIELMIYLAERLEEEPYFFLLIGGGNKFDKINRMIAGRKLSNVKLLPWQPVDEIRYSLAAGDIAVVTLGKETSNLSVPSKTFNLMSVAKPIMAIADDEAELAKIIRQTGAGKVFSSSSINEMEQFIKDCYNNRELLENYSTHSLAASLNYTPVNAALFLE